MSLNFWKNLGKAKGEQLSEGLITFAANIDPNAVSEAAVKQKQDEHDEYVRQLVDAQVDFKKEKREYDEVLALYNKKLAAAERAQAALTANPADKEAEQALIELLSSVEKVAPQLEKEKREFEQAEHLMTELQSASDAIAKELLGLREEINASKSAIKEAELNIERERKNKEKAERLAELRNSASKHDVAMNALKKQAEDKQKEADAHRIAAEQLRKPVEQTSTAASRFLDEVSTDTPSTESLQDKLARLKAIK